MLLTQFSLAEMLTLWVIGGVCGTVFVAMIAYLVHEIQASAKYKLMAEQNAQALKQLQKADAIVASDLTDEQLVDRLRSGKF